MTYPNEQTTAYSYFDNRLDHQLQMIWHKYPDGTTLSRYDYTADAGQRFLSERRQDDTAAVMWNYGYDTADQLVSAVKTTTDVNPAVLNRFAYAYDEAGNRTTEQVDDSVTGTTFDNLNRVQSQQPSGALQLQGSVSEPSTMSVNGRPLSVSSTNEFSGSIPLGVGTTPFTISATDASGNSASASFEVDGGATGEAFAYDDNGNLINDGVHTFEWDARNQLTAINAGAERIEYSYDGHYHRVRAVTKNNGAIVTDNRFVWCAEHICEDRDASNTVTRRSLALGEIVAAGARFFVTDHLGSIVGVTDETGALLARYEYDPFGRRTLVGGTDVTDVGFGGYRMDSTSGLWLAQHRPYDPNLGSWVSSDPIGLLGGSNSYRFVDDDPVGKVDPDGLASCAYKDTQLLFAWPLYFNKKLERGKWEYARDFEFEGPESELPSMGQLVECVWQRHVISESAWRLVLLDRWECYDGCEPPYNEYRPRTMDVSKMDSWWEVGREEILIPVFWNLLTDPEKACRHTGGPPNRF